MMANEIQYNSGVIIANPEDLATLAVFYDKIWLPYVATSDIWMVQFKRSGSLDFEIPYLQEDADWQASAFFRNMRFKGPDGQDWSVDRFTNHWNEQNHCLFESGILQRLEKAKGVILTGFIEQSFNNTEIHNLIDDIPVALTRPLEKFIWHDHIAHLVRNDLNKPGVFLLQNGNKREVAKSILADVVFSFCLPRLNKLSAQEILEVRRITNDNREGFSAHIQVLSSGIDLLIKSIAKKKELTEAATEIVETKLIPDYLEFKRQLATARVGKVKKVLDPLSKVLEINSSPWAPKFWYDLMRAVYLGSSGAAENRKDDLTNKALAFNYMRKMEERHARLPVS